MDHPLPPPDVLVRPWRLAAFVAASVAAVELLLLLAIGGGWLVETVASKVQVAAREHALAPKKERAQKPAPRTRAKPAAEILPRGKTVVMVLNGNGRTGAAAAAAARVRRNGYRVGTVGNAASTSFAQDLVMVKPGFAEEGQRLARALGVKRVGPLDGVRVRQLGRAHAVLILGA